MSKEVKYHYALNEQGELVSIHDVGRNEGKFFCPECHGEMIPKKGAHNAWHFAHKTETCKYDNYLHTIAEIMLQNWYNNSKEVYLSAPISEKCINYEKCVFKRDLCVHEANSKPYNLKKWFVNCEREPKDVEIKTGFRPDLFLRNNSNPNNIIFLEINVTHPCDIKKINSGYRIIEFDIESEDDIESIINNNFIQRSDKVRMYNIRGKEEFVNTRNIYFSLYKFYLHPSRKVHVDYHFSCQKLNENRGILEIIVDGNSFSLFSNKEHMFFEVALAYASKVDTGLKHCQLCKYQHLDFYDTKICALYKMHGTSKYCSENNAIECPYFKKDIDRIQQRIKIIEDYKKEHPILILLKNMK